MKTVWIVTEFESKRNPNRIIAVCHDETTATEIMGINEEFREIQSHCIFEGEF